MRVKRKSLYLGTLWVINKMDQIHFNLGNLKFYIKPKMWELFFIPPLNSINKSKQISFFHLKLLSRVKLFLAFKDLERVTHALVLSRLDSCNIMEYSSRL